MIHSFLAFFGFQKLLSTWIAGILSVRGFQSCMVSSVYGLGLYLQMLEYSCLMETASDQSTITGYPVQCGTNCKHVCLFWRCLVRAYFWFGLRCYLVAFSDGVCRERERTCSCVFLYSGKPIHEVSLYDLIVFQMPANHCLCVIGLSRMLPPPFNIHEFSISFFLAYFFFN